MSLAASVDAPPAATQPPAPSELQASDAAPEPPGNKKRKRAKRSTQQRAAAQEGTAAMWVDIDQGRMNYLKLINEIAEKHNRYVCISTRHVRG